MLCTYYLDEVARMYSSYTRFFRIGRRDLAYLKFIIEAYEGLAVLSTADREDSLVRIMSTPSLAADLDLLLAALSREITMTEIPTPPAPCATSGGVSHA
jgi:Domain of unknown function (DUF4911)